MNINEKFSPDDTIIVITSNEPWSEIFHTQLHYAYQLSKNYEVIYIDPPRVWDPAVGFIGKRKAFRENSQLLIIPYRHLFPVRGFPKLFTFFNDLLTSWTIIKHTPDSKSKMILWRFDHFRLLNFYFHRNIKTIYHVVDQYIGKPGDKELAVKSDLIIVTSPQLLPYYKSLNDHVINIPQCIPDEDFQTKQEIVDTILSQYGRYILYIGTITSEVSIELLDKIAREFPSITLLIVGPVLRLSDELLESIKKLQLNPNVYFTGSVDGRELKNYIVGAEVCLVPYKFESERKVRVRSPLKILNYISHYKPVVTSIESELPDSDKMGVYLVKNEADFINRIREILNNGAPSDKNIINAYLKGIRYPERINEILSHLV